MDAPFVRPEAAAFRLRGGLSFPFLVSAVLRAYSTVVRTWAVAESMGVDRSCKDDRETRGRESQFPQGAGSTSWSRSERRVYREKAMGQNKWLMRQHLEWLSVLTDRRVTLLLGERIGLPAVASHCRFSSGRYSFLEICIHTVCQPGFNAPHNW